MHLREHSLCSALAPLAPQWASVIQPVQEPFVPALARAAMDKRLRSRTVVFFMRWSSCRRGRAWNRPAESYRALDLSTQDVPCASAVDRRSVAQGVSQAQALGYTPMPLRGSLFRYPLWTRSSSESCTVIL